MRKKILSIILLASFMLCSVSAMIIPVAAAINETENNDSVGTATPISNEFVTGMISDRHDVDFYKYESTGTGYLVCTFVNSLLRNDGGNWGVTIYKYENTLQEIHYQEISDDIETTVLPKIGITPGEYYIAVEDVPRGGYDYRNENIEYRISVKFEENNCWEAEPNDSYVNANEITDATYSGYIRNSNDVDFYKYESNQAGYLVLTFINSLLRDNGATWGITIYKLENSLVEIHSQEIYTDVKTTILPKVGITSGTYYIKIEDVPYYNDFLNKNVEYSFSLEFTANDFWEAEANDGYTTANKITNATYSGYIRNKNDVDFYEYESDKTGYLALTFTNSVLRDDDATWKITVYKLENSYVEIFSQEIYSTKETTVLPKFSIAPGTYYIKIEDATTNYYSPPNTNIEYSLKAAYTDRLVDIGDINSDETINAKDALEVLKASVGKIELAEEQKIAADVNKDGKTDAKDALEILKYSVGKPSVLDKE